MPADPDLSPFEFMLTFGSTPVGLRLHAMGPPSVRLATDPKAIQPFWWKSVILDGRYPACIYEHSMEILLDGNTSLGYIHSLFAIDAMNDTASTAPTQAKTLLITAVTALGSAGTPLVTLGRCYMQGIHQSEPGKVLDNKFGLVEVRFIGNTRPQTI